MAFTAPASSGSFQLPPADSYISRLIRIIDLGTTMNEMYSKSQHKIAWGFELCNALMEPDENGNQHPFVQYEFLTLSMNEKANLRKRVESWRGAAFDSDEEASQYDIAQLLGKPAYLTIIHGKKGNGDDKAEIASLIKVPQGLEAPSSENEVFMFDLSEFDQGTFDKISDGFKNQIMKSDEYIAMQSPQGQSTSDNSDVPF